MSVRILNFKNQDDIKIRFESHREETSYDKITDKSEHHWFTFVYSPLLFGDEYGLLVWRHQRNDYFEYHQVCGDTYKYMEDVIYGYIKEFDDGLFLISSEEDIIYSFKNFRDADGFCCKRCITKKIELTEIKPDVELLK